MNNSIPSLFWLLFDILIAIISPYILIIRVIIGLLKDDKYIHFSISIFFGFLGFYFIPSEEMDLYRHYEFYNLLKDTGINYYYQDIGLSYIFSIFAYFDVDQRWIAFLASFVFYFMLMKISKINNIHNANVRILVTLLLVFSFPIISTTGLRFTTAIAFFMYGVCLYEKCRCKSAYIYVCIAPLFHFSVFIFIVLYASSYCLKPLIKTKSTSKIIILTFFLFLGLSLQYIVDVLVSIISIINNYIFKKEVLSASYLTGDWGVNRNDQLSFIGALFFNIKQLLLTSIMFFSIKKVDKELYPQLSTFLFLLSVVCVSFFDFGTIFFRFGYVFLVMLIFVIAKDLKLSNKVTPITVLICSYVVFSVLTDLYGSREGLILSYSNLFEVSLLSEFLSGK